MLHTRYKDLFEEMFEPMHVFAPPSNADFIPLLACHHTIADSEINAFLNQDIQTFQICQIQSQFLILVELVSPDATSQSLRL